MTYNYGDKVTLGDLGEFIVFDTCVFNDKEYMALLKKGHSEMMMVEVKNEDDLEILEDKEYIQEIIKKMAK